MTLLSICLPSYRTLQAAQASIDSALIYAEKVDAQVILSDNSGDPEKRARYEHASPRLIYLKSDGLSGNDNHMRALERVDTPFVMPMGDDDELYLLDDQPRIALETLPADVIGLRPQTLIWTKEGGVDHVDRFAIEADSAGERLSEYNGKARGNNTFYYSCYRTSIFRGLIMLFQKEHPLRGGYCDWALMFTLVSAGKFLHDAATLYRYDLGRWSLAQGIKEANESLFLAAGLPAEAEHYGSLLRFVDIHVFLAWRGLGLSPEERQGAQLANARLALSAFLDQVKVKPQFFDEEVHYLAGVIRQAGDLDVAFNLSLLILDRLQDGLSTRYAAFNTAFMTAA